jgi:hypothetical protein
MNNDKENYKTKEWGYVYCLSNESLPGLLKIGMTIVTPQHRARQLSNTSLPTPFHVEFAKFVQFPYATEQRLHRMLEENGKRINKKREHFELTIIEAVRYFETLEGRWEPPPHPSLLSGPNLPIYGKAPYRPPMISVCAMEVNTSKPPVFTDTNSPLSESVANRIGCRWTICIAMALIILGILLFFWITA